MSSKFFEKYKDPRWQRKRLLIMERDNFSCKNCGESKSELTVHHLYYEKEKDPWVYPNNSLVTYCKSCHDEWHRLKGMVGKRIGYLTAELEWLVKCAKDGPNRAIMGRFEEDTARTMALLSFLSDEAMKNDSSYHSQVVDCCLILNDFVSSSDRVNNDQGEELEQVPIIQG